MRTRVLLAMIPLALLVGACAPALGGMIDRERLHAVVARDAVLFRPPEMPVRLLDRLSTHHVLLIGEYHDITHHDAFVGELAAAMRGRGFTTVLLEFPQAYGWLIDGYVRGVHGTPGEGAKRTYGPLLDRIRQANQALPPAEHIRVHAIDVNLGDDDFLPPFRGLLTQIGFPEPLLALVADLEGGHDPAAALAAAQVELESNAEAYRAAWGEVAYRVVTDALDGEARSLEVRRAPAGAARDRAREAVMHELVERQLTAAPGGVIVNVGYFHAQKRHQTGTVDVWLAERLIDARPAAPDDVYVLVVVPASGEKTIRGRLRAFDVGIDSPPHELFRVLQQVAGGAYAFLPLDDALFTDEPVVVNYLPDLVARPPREVFDGFMLLPEVGYAGR